MEDETPLQVRILHLLKPFFPLCPGKAGVTCLQDPCCCRHKAYMLLRSEQRNRAHQREGWWVADSVHCWWSPREQQKNDIILIKVPREEEAPSCKCLGWSGVGTEHTKEHLTLILASIDVRANLCVCSSISRDREDFGCVV